MEDSGMLDVMPTRGVYCEFNEQDNTLEIGIKEQGESNKDTIVDALSKEENKENRRHTTKIIIKDNIIAPPDCSYLFSPFSNSCPEFKESSEYPYKIREVDEDKPAQEKDCLETIEGLEKLDTCSTTNMNSMFWNCNNLKQVDLSNLKTSNVSDMGSMFSMCHSLKKADLASFNTENVTNMSRMFKKCFNLNHIDLGGFSTKKVTDMCKMFWFCRSLTSLTFPESFYTYNVTDMNSMFSRCSSISKLNLSMFDTSNVTDMSWMFYDLPNVESLELENFDTSKVTNMRRMFTACCNLNYLNLSNFDTKNVTDMGLMFASCSSIKKFDLLGFNTVKVEDMSRMFQGCKALTELDLSGFSTQMTTTMESMFEDCVKLYDLKFRKVLLVKGLWDGKEKYDEPLVFVSSSFVADNVTNLKSMFKNCAGLEYLDLSDFSVNAVTEMDSMFENCINLFRVKLPNLSVDKRVNEKSKISMSRMFSCCSSLATLDLTPLDTSNVTDMVGMFDGCPAPRPSWYRE